MSLRRAATLILYGAMLGALTIAGLLFQSEHHIDRFLLVVACQAAIYLAAVWLIWDGPSSRRVVLAIAALALLVRVPVMLAPPYLSSDIYRYVWDGRVEAAGFNPYRHQPAEPRLDALRDQDIYPQIASKYAPTIYPPVAEAIFFVVTRVSESVTAMKAAMMIFELVTIVLLSQLLALEGLPAARVLVYAWHPLPLWEFAGSGHIDAALIPFCVAALWAARRGRDGLSGLFLAGAALTKLYPAALLPALYRRWDWKLPVVFVGALVAAYLPFISAGAGVLGFLPGYAGQEGFDAQGAGFYLLALLRHAPWLAGWDARVYGIAAVAVLAALSAAFVFRRDRARSLYPMAATLAGLFMVLVSPHYPWYFCWLVAFACFIRSFALQWVTNACLLLYLIAGYVFVASDQRLAIESIIYGPFAVLALIDLWYYRRRVTRRS